MDNYSRVAQSAVQHPVKVRVLGSNPSTRAQWYDVVVPMPTPELQREYGRQWIAARRSAWFEGKTCEKCGSEENLELDHRDPTVKITHRIWSWRKERQEAELAKCRVLCRECHKLKSAAEHAKGSNNGMSKLTEETVKYIKKSDQPTRMLADQYQVSMRTIQRIRKGETWMHIGTLA